MASSFFPARSDQSSGRGDTHTSHDGGASCQNDAVPGTSRETHAVSTRSSKRIGSDGKPRMMSRYCPKCHCRNGCNCRGRRPTGADRRWVDPRQALASIWRRAGQRGIDGAGRYRGNGGVSALGLSRGAATQCPASDQTRLDGTCVQGRLTRTARHVRKPLKNTPTEM